MFKGKGIGEQTVFKGKGVRGTDSVQGKRC